MMIVDSNTWADFFNGVQSPHEERLQVALDEEEDLDLVVSRRDDDIRFGGGVTRVEGLDHRSVNRLLDFRAVEPLRNLHQHIEIEMG